MNRMYPYKEKIGKARQKYQPEKIRYFYIAETSRKSESGGFFYFKSADSKDSLFLETMKSLNVNKLINTHQS